MQTDFLFFSDCLPCLGAQSGTCTKTCQSIGSSNTVSNTYPGPTGAVSVQGWNGLGSNAFSGYLNRQAQPYYSSK